MSYSLSPPSAVLNPAPVLGGEVAQMQLTEPVNGTISGSVTLKIVSDPALPDLAVYTIDTVTCDTKSEMVNAGADLVITKTNTSFTFKSAFLDLFDRTYKYTKAFEILEGTWKQNNLVNVKFSTNGTTTVKATIDNSLPMRVGDSVTISGGLTTDQKSLRGTWKIASVGGYAPTKIPQAGEAFTQFTIKINKPLTANTSLTTGYSTYHTANRARYVIPGLDSAAKVDDFHGVYELQYPPEARLVTFNVKIKKVLGALTTYENVKWSFKYLSNFNQTMNLLDLAVVQGAEAKNAASSYGAASPQGFVSIDETVSTSESITVTLNGEVIYMGV